MKDLSELQKEFLEYNNIRYICKNNIEIKAHLLTRNNENYWNLMINDSNRNISLRWHIKENDCSFENLVEVYFIPLVKHFEKYKYSDLFDLISTMKYFKECLEDKKITYVE